MLIGSWINGEVSQTIDVMDRGFLYADGLFETMRVAGQRIALLDAHLERLYRDATRLDLILPEQDQLRQEIAMAITDHAQGILRLSVTRGCGGRGYQPPDGAANVRVMSLFEYDPLAADCYTNGVAVGLLNTPISINSRLAGIKHLARLEQVLAAAEARQAGWQDGIMLDDDGYVVECSRANIFLKFGDAWVTPDLSRAGVSGVMRARMIAPMKVRVRNIKRAELLQVEAAFLTNAVRGVVPIARIDDRELRIPEEVALQVDEVQGLWA